MTRFCITQIRILLGLLLSLSYLTGISQSGQDKQLSQQLVEIADEIMNSTRAVDQARDSYEQAAQLDPTNIKANYLAGYYRLTTVSKELAAGYFEQVQKLDENYRFHLDFLIGESYQFGENFEKAIEEYEQYLAKVKEQPNYRGDDYVDPEFVRKKIRECHNGIEFVANPVKRTIVNLGNRVNSEYDDFVPIFNEDESLVIFTSRRRDGNMNEDVDDDNFPYEDIYYSRKKDGKWDYAENLGSHINTPFHDSNLAMSKDGNQLFIYKDIGKGDIFVSRKNDRDIWTEPVSLGETINTANYTESSLTLSDDGKTIIFSSDKLGGKGGFDLYISHLGANGNWGPARNLGAPINTEFPEDGPFLDHDGKTLYFSSEGHKGMGGYDIFKTVYDSAAQTWSDPINIGYPINTPDNDIFYITSADGQHAYYASVRMDGYGFLDLYEIVDPEKRPVVKTESQFPVILEVSVKDRSTGEALDATVKLIHVGTGVLEGVKKTAPGRYEITLEYGEPSEFRLEVENSGYIFETQNIRIPGMATEPTTIVRTVSMRQPVTNTRKVLRNIYFEFDKAEFKQVSTTELNKFAKMLLDNTSIKVEISGHTDNIGSADYNKKLSQARANAVKDWLVKQGVDARRITSVGYGEERPLASNDDETDGREINRRVEFKVIN